MTVQSVIQGADPEVLNARLSDGSFFLFRIEYLPAGMPLPYAGLELTDDVETAYRVASETYASELAALRLISLREHSRFLLALKLKKREFRGDAIDAVLDRLERVGLLDDERFAELWLASRIATRNEGRSKLLAGLLARGVASRTAERSLRNVFTEEAEIEAIRRMAAKAKIDTSRIDAEARSRFRAAGFSGRVVAVAFSGEEL